MRRICLILFFLLCVAAGQAWTADITRIEYFYDNDPGLGNGTDLAITAGATVTVTAELSLPLNISEGLHHLYVRAMDSDGKWGLSRVQPFYVPSLHSLSPLPDITAIEWFIDDLVDEGAGTQVAVTAGAEVEQSFNVDFSSLSEGLHYLYVRAEDARGAWGITRVMPFYIVDASALPDITAIE
jgi:hypothetical protein